MNLIVSDLLMIKFVYTLCSLTPSQIQYGRLTRAFTRKFGDTICDQVRIRMLHIISIAERQNYVRYCVCLHKEFFTLKR